MIDAVLSYHMNSETCGVARFNHLLAETLGVPMRSIFSETECGYPLLSLKREECQDDYEWTTCVVDRCQRFSRYDIFWHGQPDRLMTRAATRVIAANPSIARQVLQYRQDVIEAFCPSTIHGNPTRGSYRVLTFGMAHKLVLAHFERLKVELECEHPDYTLSLSTAVHEGSPWDKALTESASAMRAIFGDKLRILGFLGDDALAKELQDCDAVAMYFTPALRANNTSYWAAVEAGKPVYTNRDADSPTGDVSQYSWDALLQTLGMSITA